MTAIHIKAIDWALFKGYVISVTDVGAKPGEWDVWRSQDKKVIIEAIKATDLPNVYIEKLDPDKNIYIRIAVFSVVDEGSPDETIINFIAKPDGEFTRWFYTELDRAGKPLTIHMR